MVRIMEPYSGRLPKSNCGAWYLCLSALLIMGLAGCDVGSRKTDAASGAQQKDTPPGKQTARSKSTPHRRGSGPAPTKTAAPKPEDQTAVLKKMEDDGRRLRFESNCRQTLQEMKELTIALGLAITSLKRQANADPKSKSNESPFTKFLRLQLVRYQRSRETIELLTANVKNLLVQSERKDNLVHLEKELANRIKTLEETKDSLPEALLKAAKRKAESGQAAEKETAKPVQPTAPQPPPEVRKTYTLNDGRVLKVVFEASSGDKVIVKTIEGQFVTIDKGDIKQEE